MRRMCVYVYVCCIVRVCVCVCVCVCVYLCACVYLRHHQQGVVVTATRTRPIPCLQQRTLDKYEKEQSVVK